MKTKILNILCGCLISCAISVAFTACSEDNVSDLRLDGDCLVEAFALDQFQGTVNLASRSIEVRLPEVYDTKAMTVTALSISQGAACNVRQGETLNMDAARVLHVTNGDTYLDWTVNVRHDEARILQFVINDIYTGAIDQEAKTITVYVPAAIGVSNLVPTITYSKDATITPASGVAQDFSEPVTYTVKNNSAVSVYTVTVIAIDKPKAIFIGSAPTMNDLRQFYENGGSLLLTRYATNLPSFIGVTGDDEWTTPNNCWGQNEDAAELCGGPWSFRIFEGQNDHPLWANLIAGDNPQEVYCTDAGYHITNSTAQYHIGTDWGGYDNHAAWEARTGGRILGVGGDGAVVAWEYLPHDGRGGIICIGSGCYDWYSYTFEAGYTEKYHKNIEIMTKNAINYLTH